MSRLSEQAQTGTENRNMIGEKSRRTKRGKLDEGEETEERKKPGCFAAEVDVAVRLDRLAYIPRPTVPC